MISLFVSFNFKIVTDFDSTVSGVIRNVSSVKTAFYKGVTFCASGYCLVIVALLLLIFIISYSKSITSVLIEKLCLKG